MSCENLGVDTSSLQNNPPILKYASEGFWRAKIFGQRSSRKMVDCLRKIHIFLCGALNPMISASCWTTQKNISCVIFPSKRTLQTGGKIAHQICSKSDQQRERGQKSWTCHLRQWQMYTLCVMLRRSRCAQLSFFLSFFLGVSIFIHTSAARHRVWTTDPADCVL